MKSYIFGLALKILILVCFVFLIFFSLQKFENNIFSIKKQKIDSFELKNILFTLMENYEKKLLSMRSGLEEERKSLLKELDTTRIRAERNEIQKKINEIEKMQKKTAEDLTSVKNEKSVLETQIRVKEEEISSLKKEKEKLKNEFLDLKAYLENYTTNIKQGFLASASDNVLTEKINKEFSQDNGKNFLSEVLKDYTTKESQLNELKESKSKTEENIKTLKNDYNSAVKNFEEVTMLLAGNDKELLKIINETKDKKDDSEYVKKLKEITTAVITDNKIKYDSDKSSIISTKDKDIKGISDNLDKLKSEKQVLEKDIESYIKEKVKLENNVIELEGNIKNKDAEIAGRLNDIKNKESEIEILLDQSNINGYFVSKEGSTILMINKKKENEIINIGTFNVYDKNKNIVSKIYVSKQGQKVVMTKVPGYNNPMPGNWF